MSSALDTARMLTLIVWLVVTVTRLPATLRVLRGAARHYDVMECVIGSFSLITLLFTGRWFLPGNTDALWVGLYLLSGSVGVACLWTMARYEGTRHGD